jgi:rSAM/selenodomain-associated transferase 1
MPSQRRAIAIVAKAPIPGTVKTRLVPPLMPEQAARLHRAFLSDTAEAALRVPDTQVWVVHPPDHAGALRDLLPAGVGLMRQRGTDLGAIMHGALEALLGSADSVLVIGTDIPLLTAGVLCEACSVLESPCDAVLGPTEDGGYYLFGARRAHPSLFEAMAWSTPHVLAETLCRGRRGGLDMRLGTPLFDVDTPADLQRLLAARTTVGVAVGSATNAVLDDLERAGLSAPGGLAAQPRDDHQVRSVDVDRTIGEQAIGQEPHAGAVDGELPGRW